jgi:hypothetical protein
MKSAIWITLVLASCAHAPAKPPDDELIALVSAILDRDERDPDSPAGGRLLGRPPHLLQAEIGSGPLRIPPEAVVTRPAWRLQTADALQSLADA